MPTVDHQERRVGFKIVAHGLPGAGKRTLLHAMAAAMEMEHGPEVMEAGPDVVSVLTLPFGETPHTPGYASEFRVYTLGGEVQHSANWRLLERGADGLVFVADATTIDASFGRWWQEWADNSELARTVPVAGQANKQDLPGAWTAEQMADRFAVAGRPVDWFPSSSQTGLNLFAALNEVCQQILQIGAGGRPAVEETPEGETVAPAS